MRALSTLSVVTRQASQKILETFLKLARESTILWKTYRRIEAQVTLTAISSHAHHHERTPSLLGFSYFKLDPEHCSDPAPRTL